MAVTINADNGVSSGSAGLKQTADSTGVLALQTNGTTAVTVDTSQNVGIGTSSPVVKLEVKASSGAGEIRVDSSAGDILQLQSSATESRIGSISAVPLTFRTSNVEAMRIDSSGNVGIGTSSPNKKLEVLSAGEIIRATSTTGANDQLISVKNDSGTANCSTNIFFADRYAASSYASSYIRGTTSGTSALIFATGGTNFTNIYDAGAPTERMRIDSSGNLLVNTTTAQTGAKLAVTGGIQGTIQSGTAVNSTSGTSISFTSIPSWVKRITVQLNGVSTNGTSFLIIQLGTGATPTYTTTGYVSGSNSTTTTVGLLAHSGGSAADVRLGSCVLTNFGNNIWNSSASGGFSNGAGTSTAGGYISLGATLTAIRLTTVNGTDAFDAGSINILYEG